MLTLLMKFKIVRTSRLLSVILAMSWLGAHPSYGDQFIRVRVSFKAVINPVDGSRPEGIDDSVIDGVVAGMNALLDSFGRGFHMVRTGPLIDVGWMGGVFDGPSQWYYTDFHVAQQGDIWKQEMEDDALANKAEYAWQDDAINIYITEYNNRWAGKCTFPGTGAIIVVSRRFLTDGENSAGVLHEIGHYFNLSHTQGQNCGFCEADQTGECNTVPGDDNVADTLGDLSCWDQDDIALNAYGSLYAPLPPARQFQVDNVFFNIMSYHVGEELVRLTPGQLDRWTDAASNPRLPVCTGRTWVIDGNSPCAIPAGFANCFEILNETVGGPFPTVAEGVDNAQPEDIVLIRAGTYREKLTLEKPVTLRASRGPVLLR